MDQQIKERREAKEAKVKEERDAQRKIDQAKIAELQRNYKDYKQGQNK